MSKLNAISTRHPDAIHNDSTRFMPRARGVGAILALAMLLSPTLAFGTASVTLAWNPNPETDIASYQLRYGTTPGAHPNIVEAGLNTSTAVSGLAEGSTYFFVVSACNRAGLRSVPSSEISYQIPVTPTTGVSVIPRNAWTLRYVNSQASNGFAATRAFDGDPKTAWATDYLNPATRPPHEIQIDLGATYPLGGFRYLPRQDTYTNGNIDQYEFYVSTDGTQWGTPVATGNFVDSRDEQEVLFSSKSGRYVRLRILTIFNADPNSVVAELNVLQGAAVVTPPNHAPVAISKSLTTPEGTPLAVMLDASDADGNPLAYSIVTPPAHGTLSGTAPTLTYSPASNYHGADGFTFKANDGTTDSAVATVSLTITAVNHAPVFTLNPIIATNATEGAAYTGQSLAGMASDADAGDALSYSKVAGPAWLNVAANGDLSGTPPAGSAGPASFTVRATDGAQATGDTELRITVLGSLPLPWVTTEIGSGQLAGSTLYNAATFTQTGAGKLGGTSDKLRFTYQTLSGDGEIIARISALQNTGTASRVGVMIRNSLATNSIQSFMGMTGSNAFLWVRRTSTGGNNTISNSNTSSVPNTWVRLVRTGTRITAYKSTNGTSWTSVGKANFTMAANCYIGLAVSSGSDTVLNTSQLSNITVTP